MITIRCGEKEGYIGDHVAAAYCLHDGQEIESQELFNEILMAHVKNRTLVSEMVKYVEEYRKN